MAAKIINVSYKVDSKELEKAKASIQGIEKETKDSEKEMLKLNNTIKKTGDSGSQSFLNFKNILGAISVTAIIAGLTQLGRKILDLGVKQEQLNIAFTTFLGSATRAKTLLAELTKFSIVTPFSPDQVNNAAKALLAFGVQGEEIIPTLKMLGDVSSGTGKDLTEMAVIFGQIRSTGRLMGQDLLQLINAGFNPLQIISEKTGKSVKTLKEEMEKGNISFQQVSDAFKTATSEGGLFFNLMEKQSQSIGGVMSTISGNIDEGLKNIFTTTSGPLKDFIDSLNTLSENFREFTKSKEQIADEREVEIINDVTKAYDLQVKAFGDSARARERIIELIEEQKQRIREESDIQERISNQEVGFFDRDQLMKKAEKQAASDKLAQLNNEAMMYDLVVKELDEHILKTGLSTKVVNDDADAHKKTAKEIKNRSDALKALNKQMGFTTGAEKFKENQKNEEKEADRQSKAIDREIEQNQRRAEVIKANDADMEAERIRIAEEAADERIRIADEEAANIKAAQQAAFDFTVDAIGSILTAENDSYSESSEALREKYNREIELAGDNERAKDQIRLRQSEEERRLREKQTEDEKKQQTRRILIETVLNAVKALGLPPIPGANFIAAGKATAYGLLAAGLARKYKKGEVGIDGPGTKTSDSIPAMLSVGESVINADATSKSSRLLEAINDRKIDDRILGKIAGDGGRQASAFDDSRIVEAINKNKVDYDTHGYTIMKGIQKGKNFKMFIRSKVQGY